MRPYFETIDKTSVSDRSEVSRQRTSTQALFYVGAHECVDPYCYPLDTNIASIRRKTEQYLGRDKARIAASLLNSQPDTGCTGLHIVSRRSSHMLSIPSGRYPTVYPTGTYNFQQSQNEKSWLPSISYMCKTTIAPYRQGNNPSCGTPRG